MPQTATGLNNTYEQLQDVLTAGLRRQILVGVCASGQQEANFNERLQADVQRRSGKILPVIWQPEQPHLLQGIADLWQTHPAQLQGALPPTLVISQISALTHGSQTNQQRFLRQLRSLSNHIADWNFNLLLWVDAPWLDQLQHAAPEFWRWHTGVFWFDSAQGFVPDVLAEVSGKLTLKGRWDETGTGAKIKPSSKLLPPKSPKKATPTDPTQLQHALQQYRQRLAEGDTSITTLNQAIQTSETILRQTSEISAEHLNDLGNFYWMRSRQRPSRQQPIQTPAAQVHQPIQDLICALQHYEQALTKIGDPQTAPQTYAMIQNNLGAAYGDMAQHDDPVANLQRAIQAYETSLQYRTAQGEPRKYSATQNNLGTAHWHLSQHQEPALNLRNAIAAYTKAGQVYEQQADWPNWAMLQNNLGTTYWQLAQHSQEPEHLSAAIAAYHNSLKHRTADSAPAAYAATQNNIAAAHWHFASTMGQTNTQVQGALEDAIAAYSEAAKIAHQLSLQEPPIFVSFDFLAAYHNLGVVHYQLATDIHFELPAGDQQEHLYHAVEAYGQALQLLATDSDSFEATLVGVVQTVRACYERGGITSQNSALSRIPSSLLPYVLPQLVI